MSFRDHNNLTFHIQELGEGPPVVMLHGLFGGSMASWYFTSAPTIARTHRVLLYDLRGHGKSARSRTGYDVATMVSDLESIAAEFSTRPISLVGHSYGAIVSLEFALRNPSRVHKLVIVEGPLPPSQVKEFDAFRSLSLSEKAASLPKAVREAFRREGRQAERFAESMRFFLRESSLFDDLRAASDIADERLATLHCPTLCIYGSNSSCLPAGERIARAVPRAELVVLAGGHFLQVDAGEPLTASITEFLNG